MISYSVIVNHPKDQKEIRQHISPKDEGYQEHIFSVALRKNKLREGDRVKVRGTSNKGVVKAVVTTRDDVSWVKNKPYFLEVRFDTGVHKMCNPSQLKRSK